MSRSNLNHAICSVFALMLLQAAHAGDCVTQVIDDNAKMKTLEHICAPGDGAPTAKRGWRAFYLIEGGMLERKYEDGSTETISYKTGESKSLADDRPFSYRNVGHTTIKFFIVYPKY